MAGQLDSERRPSEEGCPLYSAKCAHALAGTTPVTVPKRGRGKGNGPSGGGGGGGNDPPVVPKPKKRAKKAKKDTEGGAPPPQPDAGGGDGGGDSGVSSWALSGSEGDGGS